MSKLPPALVLDLSAVGLAVVHIFEQTFCTNEKIAYNFSPKRYE